MKKEKNNKTINIDPSIHSQLKSFSALKNKKIIEIANIAILKYIESNDDADLIIINNDGTIIKEYYNKGNNK